MREQAGQTGTTRLEGGGFTLVRSETPNQGDLLLVILNPQTNQEAGRRLL